MARVKDLTKGSPIKLMLIYALPVLLGNIFQQVYNLADTIIVGQCLGQNALAAVGTTGSLYFLVNGFVVGITSGFTVHVSQRFGAKDYDGMRNSMFNAVLLWVAITIVMTLFAVIFARPTLRLINTPDGIIDDAYTYIVTIYAGILAPMLYNGASCILRAVGDSKTPLYFLIVSAALNIGMDLLFIMVFEMGVFGAALATVIAQFISGMLCIIYMIIKFPILHLRRDDLYLNRQVIAAHLKIGLPMAFQFSITAIGTIILQGAINMFGEVKIAAYTAASKTEQLVTQIAGAAGVTTANFVGQNTGAGQYARIRKGVRQWSFVTIAGAVFAMAVIFFFGRDICGLFIQGKDPVTLDASMIYLNTVVVFFIPLFLIFIFRNALQAMGKTFMPLMAGVFELAARTVVSFTLPSVIGFQGVCLAGPIAWVCAMLPLFITYLVYMRIFKKKGYFKVQEG